MTQAPLISKEAIGLSGRTPPEATAIAGAPVFRFAKRASRMSVSAVREILKVTERPEIISFAGGLPAPELFPVQEIAKAHAEVFANDGPAALQYSTTEGWRPLREWIAARMSGRGVQADADRVVITSGSQQGIDLVAKVLLDPGDAVIVENPCYLAALQAFGGYEASFIAVGSDDEGMRVDEVEQALVRGEAKLIYIVTDFHNPKGTSLSFERRRRLVELAQRYRVPILEDDPYSELRFAGERLPSLAALDDKGVVIHISTFSKTLSPGIRIGWATGNEEIIHSLVVAKQAADLHTSTIQQRAAARLLEGFEYDSHIATLTEVYGERCRTMIDAIASYFPSDARPTRPEGGLFLWVELPGTIDGEELLKRALEEQVAFVPGAPFFAADAKSNFIRLNFSNQTPNLIEEGIKRLGRVIKR